MKHVTGPRRLTSHFPLVFALPLLTLTGFCLAQPAVKLSVKDGPPTSTVTVSGSGFGDYAAVDIYFDTSDEGLALANGSGEFSGIAIEVTASALPGTHWISAVQRSTDTGAQAPFVVETNWSQFGFTPRNQRNNYYENVLNQYNVGSIDVQWAYSTGGAVESSPVVADGVLYVGSDDGNLYALNASTGALKWSFPTGGPVQSSPAVSGGLVFVGTNNCTITCQYGDSLVALTTAGAVAWSFPTGGPASSPVVVDGVVYFVGNQCNVDCGYGSSTLYALQASTGSELWSSFEGGGFNPIPAISNNTVYLSDGFELDTHNVENGTPGWYYSIGEGHVVGNTTTVADGAILIWSEQSGILALSTTGAQLWSYSSDSYSPTCCTVAGSYIYFNSYPFLSGSLSPQTVNGLYIENFTPLLQWAVGSSSETSLGPSSPAVANGVVYVSSIVGVIYAYLAQSGGVLWSYPTGGTVDSSPIVANGVVYVGSADNNVYAFSLAGGQQVVSTQRPALSALHPDLSLNVSRPSTTLPRDPYE